MLVKVTFDPEKTLNNFRTYTVDTWMIDEKSGCLFLIKKGEGSIVLSPNAWLYFETEESKKEIKEQ
jgi:hypothetical protein